jgi:hypothetical protein
MMIKPTVMLQEMMVLTLRWYGFICVLLQTMSSGTT